MARWGDVVGPFTGEEWPPPDGSVDIIDVLGILYAFRGLSNAPPLHRADLIGTGGHGIVCEPDGTIDIMDALVALRAFSGWSYFDSTGCPVPCSP